MGFHQPTGGLGDVPTLVRDRQPKEFEALLVRRRQLGQDRYDEVWDGVYVTNPAPSYEQQWLGSTGPSNEPTDRRPR